MLIPSRSLPYPLASTLLFPDNVRRSQGGRLMILSSAKLTEKYQITIPSEVRRRLSLEAGDVVLLRLDGDEIKLDSAKGGWGGALRGLGADLWQDAGGAAAIEREREGWE